MCRAGEQYRSHAAAGVARCGRHLRPVFAYDVDESLALEQAAREYRRTAELLAA